MKMFPILSNDDILTAAEHTPSPEGGTLSDFVTVAEQTAAAAAPYMQKIDRYSAEMLFLMRAMYLCGVQHGAEACRNHVLSELEKPVCDPLPFVLDDMCASLWVDDLKELADDDLEKMACAAGLMGTDVQP